MSHKINSFNSLIISIVCIVSINAAAINLPKVVATTTVAPELRALFLEDIFLGDRLGTRKTDSALVAKLKNSLLTPAHAIYANQTMKFVADNGLTPKHYHDKVVLVENRDGTKQIGVAYNFTHNGVNVKDSSLVNSYQVNLKDIKGVLLWHADIYGETAHFTSLEEARLMYVIEDINTQELLANKHAEDNPIYELMNFKLDGKQPTLPDNTAISGQVIALFSDGSKLVVGEHYRNLNSRDEWMTAIDGEQLHVYLIK
ncbi:MAG: hypothetical protein OYH77_01280 [Pseudomonadota bacterium]|nr:hypothetical protein [Pseudomonadota bacterium]